MKKYGPRTLALFLLALALRAGYTLRTPVTPLFPDAGTTDVIAWNVASKGLYLSPEGQPTAYRPPSYVLFVASIYKAFGHNLMAVRLIQAGIGAILVIILVSLARRLTNNPLAPWLAGGMAALYPFFIYYDSQRISESFLVFWVVLSIGLFLDWQKKPHSNWKAAACGLGFAILALAKTVFIMLFLAIVAIETLVSLRQRDLFGRLGRLSVMVLVFAFPIFLWGQRNESLFGRFVLDTHGGETSVECIMFYAQCKQGIFPEFFRDHPMKRATEGMNEAEADAYFMNQTKLFVQAYPWRYMRQCMGNFKNFWRIYPRSDINFPEGRNKLILVSLLTEPFLILTGFWGLYLTRGQWRTLYPVYLLIIMFTALHTLTTGQMRYRLPLMPFFIIFSAIFIASKLKPSRTR